MLAIMVEVNCRLYMDERTGAKLAGFEEVRERVGGVVRAIAAAGTMSPDGDPGSRHRVVAYTRASVASPRKGSTTSGPGDSIRCGRCRHGG